MESGERTVKSNKGKLLFTDSKVIGSCKSCVVVFEIVIQTPRVTQPMRNNSTLIIFFVTSQLKLYL